jgi:hypothetical protein
MLNEKWPIWRGSCNQCQKKKEFDFEKAKLDHITWIGLLKKNGLSKVLKDALKYTNELEKKSNNSPC